MNTKETLIAFIESYLKEVKEVKISASTKALDGTILPPAYRKNNAKLQRLRIAVNQLGIDFEKEYWVEEPEFKKNT